MTSGPEDKRTAVGLSTTLSGQLVQAAVAMLTVEGAYIAYALVSRQTHPAFNLVAFLAAVAFVMSVYFSGKGITEARNSGFQGDWSLSKGKEYFNLQTISLILGLVLFAAILFLSGSSKESSLDARVEALTSEVIKLNERIDQGRKQNEDQALRLSEKIEAELSRARAASSDLAASGSGK